MPSGKHYEFDRDSFSFRKKRITVLSVLSVLLKFFLASFSVAVVIYLVFALLVNSDVEGRLSRENRLYGRMYSSLKEKDALLEDAVSGLQVRDNDIYNEIFHSPSPKVDPAGDLGLLFSSDSIPDTRMVSYTRDKADFLLERTVGVDGTFEEIFRILSFEQYAMPPMSLPLEGITYPQIGASVGEKFSPFLKTRVSHTGLDFIVSLEDPVFASADGVVSGVMRSTRGHGNVVEIEHDGGFVTRYEHLSATSVRKGATVARGDKIGTVGMSGNSLAPHLHYEVIRDGVPVDPVDYLFASINPQDYANMLFMAVNTEQSMD